MAIIRATIIITRIQFFTLRSLALALIVIIVVFDSIERLDLEAASGVRVVVVGLVGGAEQQVAIVVGRGGGDGAALFFVAVVSGDIGHHQATPLSLIVLLGVSLVDNLFDVLV